MISKQTTSSVFIAGGGVAGAGFSATVGGMGLVGGFGGIGVGMAPVAAAGTVAGAAVYGAFHALSKGDATAVGAIGIGAIGGMGISATVGGMGLSVGGSAIGIGMGTMAFAGGVFGLGIYGLYQALSGDVGRGAAEAFDRAESQILEREAYATAYTQALMELDPLWQELEWEYKFSRLEIEDELAELKAQVLGSRTSQFATPTSNSKTNIPHSPPKDEKHLAVRDNQNCDWQCVGLLKGHTASVNQLAMSADGQILASASNDRTIRLWNAKEGTPIFTFFGTKEVNTVAIDLENNLLVGGDFEGTITSWNLDSKTLRKTTSNRSFSGIHGGIVFAIDLCSKQRTIVSGSSDGSIKIWDRICGDLKQILNGHTDAVRSVKISQNGKFMVSGSVDGTARIWSLERHKPLRILTGHSGWVTAVDVSGDDRTIATGSTDGTVKIWNLQTGELRQTLTGHSSAVFSVAIAPGSNTIASASRNEVKIWNLQTGEYIQDIAGNYPVIFGSDGYTLVAGDLQNRLRIWQQSSQAKGNSSVVFGEWWQILGVDIDASWEEVKLMYRSLARLYHPDLNSSLEAIAQMQAINHAYEDFLKRSARA